MRIRPEQPTDLPGIRAVNLAAFDVAVGETGDAFKEASAETRAENESGNASTSPRMRDDQARSAKYTADRQFLDLQERLQRLVPVEEAKEGGIKIGEAVVAVLGRLPSFADQM